MTIDTDVMPMITSVSTRNFRSIQDTELELGALTVLVGPNASGKSNLLDVLGFLGDIARFGLDSAITRRGGIDSVGRRTTSGRVTGPEVGFEYRFADFTVEYAFSLGRQGRGEFRVRKEYAKLKSLGVEKPLSEIELTDGRIIKPNLKRLISRIDSGDSDDDGHVDWLPSIARHLLDVSDDKELQLITTDPARVSIFVAMIMSRFTEDDNEPYLDLDRTLQQLRGELSRFHLYHIFPNSLRDPQKVADSHPLAEGGENLASTLRDMIQRTNPYLPGIKTALNYAVPGISDIRVSSAGSYYVVELKHVKDPLSQRGSWFDLSYESDGTIRLLALLTALSQEPAPSLIGLEEPELAIHPGAMAVLAEAMNEAATRGQILVATHSPDLIDKLPIESLLAVAASDGSTRAGKVAEHQLKSVREGLFQPGELHSMEGLEPEIGQG